VCVVQIAEDIMSASRSLALHTKDLVVAETKPGSLTMFTLDYDNSEASTDPQSITQVTELNCVRFYVLR